MVARKLRGEIIERQTGTMATYLTNFMYGAGVVNAQKELYIAIGFRDKEKKVFEQVLQNVPPKNKFCVDSPAEFGPLGFLMVGYSVVGQIQKNYPDFNRRIKDYKARIKDWVWPLPIEDQCLET